MPWLLCLLVISPLVLLWFLFQPSQQAWHMGQKIPGPKVWPIIGNIFFFLNNISKMNNILHLIKTYGPVSRLWMGNQLWVFLTDPKDLAVVLTDRKYQHKGKAYRMLQPWMGQKGLITANYDTWMPHRKLITHSFHIKILELYMGAMERNAAILCDQLRNKTIGDEEFNIFPYLSNCTLDTICEAAMGVQIRAQELKDTGYPRSVEVLARTSVDRATSPWLYNDFIFRHLTSVGHVFYRELKKVKTFVYQVIQERKKTLQKEITSGTSNDSNGVKKAKSFLNFLLLESNFTDEEIENEVQTFMFAGNETMTSALAFCLSALSQHQNVQEKVYQEIRNHFVENEGKVTYQDYNNKLGFLDCVINETMRLYTTVPTITRTILEDVAIPSGYTLPKDTQIVIPFYILHNDEKHFPNHDQFIPERFENREKRENFTFLPFSAGPRNCVGGKYAKLNMKIVLSAVLRRYKFLPSRKVESRILDMRMVLESTNGHPVRITLRGDGVQS